jgi:hypothetical protein
VRLTCEQVRRDVLRQLRVPEHLLFVTKMKEATFLLLFERLELRNAALGRGLLTDGVPKAAPHADGIIYRKLCNKWALVQGGDHR